MWTLHYTTVRQNVSLSHNNFNDPWPEGWLLCVSALQRVKWKLYLYIIKAREHKHHLLMTSFGNRLISAVSKPNHLDSGYLEVSILSRVFSFSGLLGDHLSDSEAECCDVRWDSKMDNPSGGTLKRTASSCQPEGASVTSAATPRLCSGRLKICLLALVLLHTVIFISASHNSTLVGVAAIFSPEESASNDEWTSGLNLVLVKSDVAWEDYGFYNVMAARDTSGETCWKCLYNLPQMNHQPQEVGGF